MSWQRGRAEVEGLLERGELERVPASAELAERLLDDAERHLASARGIGEADPSGAYQLAYDGARKACHALLAVQGLRATTRGGHLALQDVVRAQFDGPFDLFPRLRRRRHESEYPDLATPTVTIEDAVGAVALAERLVAASRSMIASGELGTF